jgi:hypothetical protein
VNPVPVPVVMLEGGYYETCFVDQEFCFCSIGGLNTGPHPWRPYLDYHLEPYPQSFALLVCFSGRVSC